MFAMFLRFYPNIFLKLIRQINNEIGENVLGNCAQLEFLFHMLLSTVVLHESAHGRLSWKQGIWQGGGAFANFLNYRSQQSAHGRIPEYVLFASDLLYRKLNKVLRNSAISSVFYFIALESRDFLYAVSQMRNGGDAFCQFADK